MSKPSIWALGHRQLTTGLRDIAIAVSLSIAMPVLAAPLEGPPKRVSEKWTQDGKPVRKTAAPARTTVAPHAAAPEPGRPSEPAPVAHPSIEPTVVAVNDTAPSAAVTSAPTAAPPAAALSANTTKPSENPYLAGWFRATPVSELPHLAAQHFGSHMQWAIQGVTSLPGQVVDALPSIKRVFPTGGRELWVVNVKCPAEMVTGQYFFPANAARDAVSGLLQRLNDSQLLRFDIQLVCS